MEKEEKKKPKKEDRRLLKFPKGYLFTNPGR